MGINGRMRQETRAMWRHHRLFSHSCGECTERNKDQDESKSEGRCLYQSESGPDRQCCLEDNVCPRSDRELHAFKTASGQIMHGRGRDLTGTP